MKPLPATELRRVLQHCPDIDSLRALAMIGVVAMHSKIMPFGWMGVWLFFVVSGYVVTLSIARNHDPRDPLRGAGQFVLARIGRILPAYYTYLLLGLVLSMLLSVQQPMTPVLSLFGFYNNVAMANGQGMLLGWPVGHLWTISIEMQFYLLYGLVAYFMPLAMTMRLLWACVILSPLARMLAGAAMAGGDPEAIAYTIYSAPGLHFDSFALGCLFALTRLTTPLERILWPVVRVGLVAVAVYIVAYLALNVLVRDREGIEIVRDVISGILYGEGREVFLYTALALGFLALLALTVAQHPLVRPITSQPILHWIGRISYGCYIYHALCIRFATMLFGGGFGAPDTLSLPERLLVFMVALASTIAIAALSWRFIERPAARLLRRWSKSRRRSEPAPAVIRKAAS